MLKLTQTVLNNLRTTTTKVLKYDKYLKSTVVEAIEPEDTEKAHKYVKSQNSMVAAAFASLKPNTEPEIRTPVTDDKISKASSIDELLSISVGNGVSRRHALKVVSTLAEWSSSGKTKVADFENDARFIKLCRILSKGAKITRNVVSRSEDLSTILGVTADDEAARLVSSLTVSQMVKVMSTLTLRKRRSVLLLRTLAYNVTASTEQLNLKQSADLLYSMCLLNFVDNNLLAKICGDINGELRHELKRSAVIGSVVTSLGLLKYKNCEMLDALSEWILRNHSICRPQDIFSLFTTLATINYLPANSEQLFKVLLPQMSISEARKPSVWLNFVWSLVILKQASPAHIASVLTEDFVNKIEGSMSLNVSAKIKLLNINGAAKYLLGNYDGEVLSPLSSIHSINIVKTKEKAEMTAAVIDTLKNLIHTEEHLKVNTDTEFGCCIDAECLLDKKCTPLPFNKGFETKSDVTRVAVLVFDYHDMCIGKIEPSGANVLISRLLQSQNYKILAVPYTEFKITDKLVHRVQYLENRLKNIVK